MLYLLFFLLNIGICYTQINNDEQNENFENFVFCYPSKKCSILKNGYYIIFSVPNNSMIQAICDGKVVFINKENNSISIEYKNKNNILLIKYVGLNNILVQEGDIIKKGQNLGNSIEKTISIRILFNDFIYKNIQFSTK